MQINTVLHPAVILAHYHTKQAVGLHLHEEELNLMLNWELYLFNNEWQMLNAYNL